VKKGKREEEGKVKKGKIEKWVASNVNREQLFIFTFFKEHFMKTFCGFGWGKADSL
jgi:hypothetical protein